MTSPYLFTWIVLSLLTLVSWWLDASVDGAWIGTAVLLVAFFKARLVLMEFMEVRSAVPGLRWACEAWVVVACTAVVATYWFAPCAWSGEREPSRRLKTHTGPAV